MSAHILAPHLTQKKSMFDVFDFLVLLFEPVLMWQLQLLLYASIYMLLILVLLVDDVIFIYSILKEITSKIW